jgi:hypothetical protein
MFPKKGFYKKAVHKKVIIILFSVMRLKLAKKQKKKETITNIPWNESQYPDSN